MTAPVASSSKAILAAAALLVVAIVAAWSNSLDGPFVLDDLLNISQNESIRHLGDWQSVLSPPADNTAGGRPILNLSFALNYAAGKNAVRGYHAGNLAIHVLAALTLFALVRRTLLTPMLRGRFTRASTWLAFGAALLWALHPLQTASVTYISQRAESLMGLFYLLVLYCVVRSATPGASRAWRVAAVMACALGIGTKEVMVTAPLVALLYDRTFIAGSFRAAWRQRPWLYGALLATCGLLFFFMRGIVARGIGADGVSPLAYLLIECRVLLDYLRFAVWPHPLVLDYGDFAPAVGLSIACGLIVLLLIAVVVRLVMRCPAIGFLGAWFFVILAPTSSVVPVTFQPMGENRVYLPLAALCVAAVIAADFLARQIGRVVVLAAAVAALILTLQRNSDYRDPVHLWAQTLAQRPNNARATNEYGLSLAQAGRTEDAFAFFQRAIARRPDDSLLHRNFGLLLARQHRIAEALPHLARVVELEPKVSQARQDYGHALASLARYPEAIEQIRAGVALSPRDHGAHMELARLLAQSGQSAAAITEFETAVQLAPADPDLRNEFAATLLLAGRVSDAMSQYAAGLQHEPKHPGLLYNYGRLLIGANRADEALGQFQTLVQVQPTSAAAEFALANTLATLGRLSEAMPHYEAALHLDPNLPQAREFYEMAKARLAP